MKKSLIDLTPENLQQSLVVIIFYTEMYPGLSINAEWKDEYLKKRVTNRIDKIHFLNPVSYLTPNQFFILNNEITRLLNKSREFNQMEWEIKLEEINS